MLNCLYLYPYNQVLSGISATSNTVVFTTLPLPWVFSNLERDLHEIKCRAAESTAARDVALQKQLESEAGLERVQKEKIAIDSVLQTLKADMVKVSQ